ncbi:NAD(P)/FAD-dependent oxidoreductase [soil metagenome]
MTRRTIVIGGGISGAVAARRLAHAGEEVVLLERSDHLGGLVTSFELAGTPLECFYHHVFPHEREIRELIDDLGLGPRLGWYPSSVGVLSGGRVWPFTTPWDLLRFGPLPPVDRIRAGLGALRMGRVRDWEELDEMPARDWLTRYTGARTTEVVWDPLLRAKFGPAAASVPAAWMWARFQQRAGARTGRGEQLGYLRGGFRQLFEALERDLSGHGVDLRVATAVEGIEVDGRAVTGVSTTAGPVEGDAVIYAGTLPGISRLVPPHLVEPSWEPADGLGVLCVVVELTRPVSDIYWTNVCEPTLPFGGLIEHTNLIPTSDYGGRHVIYLSRYFVPSEPVAAAEVVVEAGRWVAALVDLVPGLGPSDVLGVHPFRAPYAAPLVRTGYRRIVPPLHSAIEGLLLATTAQVYPQDRGMSEAVRLGNDAAGALLVDRAGNDRDR